MKHGLAIVLAIFIPLGAVAQAAEPTLDDLIVTAEATTRLEDFLWKARPVVVFADSPEDPRFIEQMDRLAEAPAMLAEREVVILTDTDPGTVSELRRKLRPRGFMLVLIGKDGAIELRKPLPWTVRELTRSIDKMPIRQREIQMRHGILNE